MAMQADADRLHASILRTGADKVIPPKRSRPAQRARGKKTGKECNAVGGVFNKFNHFCGVAIRCGRLFATISCDSRQILTTLWRPPLLTRSSIDAPGDGRNVAA